VAGDFRLFLRFLSAQLSLRSKRFGKAFRALDALFAFLAAGKLGRAQKSEWRGRGKDRRKRLPANPTILKKPVRPRTEFPDWRAMVVLIAK